MATAKQTTRAWLRAVLHDQFKEGYFELGAVLDVLVDNYPQIKYVDTMLVVMESDITLPPYGQSIMKLVRDVAHEKDGDPKRRVWLNYQDEENIWWWIHYSIAPSWIKRQFGQSLIDESELLREEGDYWIDEANKDDRRRLQVA
jgi:hypothetical protein